MSSLPPDDVPVLTEVLVPGNVAFRTMSEAAHSAAGMMHNDEDWDILERDVREAVLKGLQARIDLVLEQRIKEIVGTLFEQALNGMAAELKIGLTNSVRDVVNRAVMQEISRVRATRVS